VGVAYSTGVTGAASGDGPLADRVREACRRGDLALDVHGLRVVVRTDWAHVRAALALDYATFIGTGTAMPSATSTVEIVRAQPRPWRFAPVPASFVTPRNVVYQLDRRSVIDYQGRVLAEHDRDADRIVVEGLDAALAHEAAYQFVLSRIGAHLDAIGLPRLHALALAGPRATVAVLLPSGGGKSTLALRALSVDGIRLISEDTPLVGAGGRLHPFVLRMGVNPADARSLPGTASRLLERMEFHPKYAVEVATFADRLATEPHRMTDLVVGVRTLGSGAHLQRAPRRAALGPLLREGVIGVGVYQGMEFVLQRGMRDTAAHAGTALLRARRLGRALAGARVWQLHLGTDRDANWEALRRLLL
jgi:hypothetical protein